MLHVPLSSGAQFGDFAAVCPVTPMPATNIIRLTLKAVVGMNRDGV